jgi:predicted ester cyclase
MSSETNKAAVRRCWEETWNLGTVTLLDELYSPDNVHHFGAKPVRFGPDQRAAMEKAWRTAVPDFHCHIEELVSEGDLVVMRLRFTGTHSAAPLDLRPHRRAEKPNLRRIRAPYVPLSRWQDRRKLGYVGSP